MPRVRAYHDETNWNQAADGDSTTQLATIVAWIHHHTRCGITPTIVAWAQSKTLVSDAEAPAASQT